MNYKKLIATACFAGIGLAASAQSSVINDTTKAIYGSATTLKLYERDVFKGNLTPARIDTAITNLPIIRHWYYDSTLHQDLGNVGTAAQPLFWQMPTVLGTRLGRNTLDRYTPDPASIEYYDTKSPFTFLNYLQGSLGEQIFKSKHTRNIKPNWNIGIGYELLSSERQIGGVGGRQNDLISHYGLMAFTQYASPNERYRIMANYIQTSHDQIESGGINPAGNVDGDEDLFDGNEAVWLFYAASEEKRRMVHATQWYKLLGSGLQLYHTIDAYAQDNEFSDNQLPYETIGEEGNRRRVLQFYPQALRDTAQTSDKSNFRKLENTFGVMGNSRLFVYRAYVKRRDGDYEVTSRGRIAVVDQFKNRPFNYVLFYEDQAKRTFADNFIGGDAQFRLKNDIYMHTDAEFQIGGGDYRINAQARYKFLTLRQTRTSYSPSLLQNLFISNHLEWNNDFENIQVNQSAAVLEGRIKNHLLQGELKFTNLRNYVYYQDSLSAGDWAKPAQVAGGTNLLQASLRYKLSVKSFVLDNTVFYSATADEDVIRMPEWYLQTRAYVHGPMFKGAIYVQTGVDVNFHTAYLADGYMPVTQQFHLQNDFTVKRYPTADVYLSADIKTVNLFIKARHLNTAIPGLNPGYFTTPYYSANPFSLIFGLQWNFYD
ncbi:putative porin [Rufibacter roseus]|uniref:Porin n=1 Tax=Rufibacter roseus TaxID=1567108 RepID=A0ABW2DPP6_9BACT|nr:putative porin [Rufibacter roseus]